MEKILDSSKIFILEENMFHYTKDTVTLLITKQRILLGNFLDCFEKKKCKVLFYKYLVNILLRNIFQKFQTQNKIFYVLSFLILSKKC